MKFTDAVRELTENPKAEKITWPILYHMARRTHGLIRLEGKTLVFDDGTPILKAGPDFLLREDFEVLYKMPKMVPLRNKMPECVVIFTTFLFRHGVDAREFLSIIGVNLALQWPVFESIKATRELSCVITSNQYAQYLAWKKALNRDVGIVCKEFRIVKQCISEDNFDLT